MQVGGPPQILLGPGADEVSVVVSALPSLVVEAWALYRCAFELLGGLQVVLPGGATATQPPAVVALRKELDDTLPALREFFGRVQRAAATHSLHPYLDVLVSLPAFPEASPFRDARVAASFIELSRHEGVGVAGSDLPTPPVPTPSPSTGPAAVAAGAPPPPAKGQCPRFVSMSCRADGLSVCRVLSGRVVSCHANGVSCPVVSVLIVSVLSSQSCRADSLSVCRVVSCRVSLVVFVLW